MLGNEWKLHEKTGEWKKIPKMVQIQTGRKTPISLPLKDAFFFVQNLFPTWRVGNANTERSVAMILAYFFLQKPNFFWRFRKK